MEKPPEKREKIFPDANIEGQFLNAFKFMLDHLDDPGLRTKILARMQLLASMGKLSEDVKIRYEEYKNLPPNKESDKIFLDYIISKLEQK